MRFGFLVILITLITSRGFVEVNSQAYTDLGMMMDRLAREVRVRSTVSPPDTCGGKEEPVNCMDMPRIVSAQTFISPAIMTTTSAMDIQ